MKKGDTQICPACGEKSFARDKKITFPHGISLPVMAGTDAFEGV